MKWKRVDRWLLARYPHVWGVGAQGAIQFVLVTFVPLFLIVIAVMAIFRVTADLCLIGAHLLFGMAMAGWVWNQPELALPHDPVRARPAIDDLRVTFTAAGTAFIIGCGIFAPVIAASAVARMPEPRPHVAETIHALEVASAYMDPDAGKALRAYLYRARDGQRFDARALDEHAKSVISRRDNAALWADMQRYAMAMQHVMPASVTSPDQLANTAYRCVAARSWTKNRVEIASQCFQFDSTRFDLGFFGNELTRNNWISPSGILRLVCAIALLSFWFGITLAWTVDALVAQFMGLFGMLVTAALALNAAAAPAGRVPSVLSIAPAAVAITLWSLFVMCLVAMAYPSRTSRVNGFRVVVGVSLCAVILIEANMLYPAKQLREVQPHAIAVAAAYALLVPLFDYLRKRVLAQPAR